jgi:hypothetical protein
MTASVIAPAPLSDAPSPLQEVVARIISSRRITRIDQCLLLALSGSSSTDQHLINQVFDCLRQGRLRVVE